MFCRHLLNKTYKKEEAKTHYIAQQHTSQSKIHISMMPAYENSSSFFPFNLILQNRITIEFEMEWDGHRPCVFFRSFIFYIFLSFSLSHCIRCDVVHLTKFAICVIFGLPVDVHISPHGTSEKVVTAAAGISVSYIIWIFSCENWKERGSEREKKIVKIFCVWNADISWPMKYSQNNSFFSRKTITVREKSHTGISLVQLFANLIGCKTRDIQFTCMLLHCNIRLKANAFR